MDTKFQTSFIPKRPISGVNTSVVTKHAPNLISIIAGFIFIIALLASGGEFGYKQYLNSKIATMDAQLIATQASIQDDLINQFIRLDSRIKSAQELLQGHIATSLLFSALQNQTVKNIQFSNLSYQTDSNAAVIVVMKGLATNYNDVALQESLFDQNKYIKDPVFSDFLLDEKGHITFSFKATISHELIAQKNTISSLTAPSQ